jgi:hypothetical protein
MARGSLRTMSIRASFSVAYASDHSQRACAAAMRTTVVVLARCSAPDRRRSAAPKARAAECGSWCSRPGHTDSVLAIIAADDPCNRDYTGESVPYQHEWGTSGVLAAEYLEALEGTE